MNHPNFAPVGREKIDAVVAMLRCMDDMPDIKTDNAKGMVADCVKNRYLPKDHTKDERRLISVVTALHQIKEQDISMQDLILTISGMLGSGFLVINYPKEKQ